MANRQDKRFSLKAPIVAGITMGGLAGLLVMVAPRPADAALFPAVTSVGPGETTSPSTTEFTGTVGYQFTLSRTYNGTALGVFDSTPQNPLEESHQVGIWNANGSLITSAIVQANSELFNGFRWITNNFTLTPGTYTIGAFYNPTADLIALRRAVTTAAGVAILPEDRQSLTTGTSGLFAPPTVNETFDTFGLFGPNFAEEGSATTVPGPLPIFGSMAAFGWSRRMRKRISTARLA